MSLSPSPSAPAQSTGLGRSLATFFEIDVSQFIQIAFWVTAAIVAVLTYRQARSTVFQPLRVEVFKRQLDVITEISAEFISRDEHALSEYFDLRHCVEFNASLMFEEYMLREHRMKREVPLMNEYRTDFPVGIVSLEAMGSDFELVAPPARSSTLNAGNEAPPAEWGAYTHGVIAASREYAKAREQIFTFIRDPLVPTGLADLLKKLVDRAEGNLHAIRPAMEQASSELRDSYPSPESASSFRPAWVVNIWNDQYQPLEDIAVEIGNYARAFVETERSGFRKDTRGYLK